MKKPNFFIIGAPKCGTTSLYEWLKKHENIFMSEIKEPCYFNTDERNRNITSIEKYEYLFSEACDKHKAVGEASVWYLGSKEAVCNINKYNPNSKLLVCIRNPVEMAISLHEQQLFSGNEYIKKFENAWKAQVDRKGRRKISYWTREHKHLIYGEVCKMGVQIERLLSSVDSNRVKIVLLEDLKKDAKKEYKKVLKFIGLDEIPNIDFEAKNKGGRERRSRVLRIIERSVHNLKNHMGIYSGIGIGEMISNMNKYKKNRSEVREDIMYDMKEYFKKDIERLERITGRDLSHWI